MIRLSAVLHDLPTPVVPEQVAAAGLRADARMAEAWGLTVDEQLALLGRPPRSTCFARRKAPERARDELGEIQRVPRAQRRFGPGSGPSMAACTQANTEGSRFSAGEWGVFCAAKERETAVAETRLHHARFRAATRQRPLHLPMRLLTVALDAKLQDLRPPGSVPAAAIDREDDSASRALGAPLHAAGPEGVVYPSVRQPRGQCAGLFTPRRASRCVHAAVLLYAWDGVRFTDVNEKTA
jgi:hypothetical protein